MFTSIRSIWVKHRLVRWGLQLLLVLTVFAGINAYKSRDLLSGPAPVVQGILLDGASVSLQDYRGQPVLVHLWATWCPVCRLEDGSIQSISEDYAVITIATQSGDAEEVKKYLQENNLSFPVLLDPEGHWLRRFQTVGVPSSFIIAPDGQIRFAEVGYSTELGLRLRLWWAGRG